MIPSHVVPPPAAVEASIWYASRTVVAPPSLLASNYVLPNHAPPRMAARDSKICSENHDFSIILS